MIWSRKTNMDCEILINLVHERSTLWDQKSKNYHNRDMTRKLWKEVAQELNITCEAAKTKWKGLRDTFRRKHQEITSKRRDGAEGAAGTSWPYYESMTFLIDHMTSKTAESVSQSHNSEEKSWIGEDETVDEDVQMPTTYNGKNSLVFIKEETRSTLCAEQDLVHSKNEDNLETESLPSTSGTNKHKYTDSRENSYLRTTRDNSEPEHRKERREIFERLLNIEEERLNLVKRRKLNHVDSVPDYDYCFLKSLLPHLKNIRRERKLLVQMKLQQVIIDEYKIQSEDLPEQLSNNISGTTKALSPTSKITEPGHSPVVTGII